MKHLFDIILFMLVWFCPSLAVAQPRLTSNTQSHNFGQVQWKQPVSVTYTITNTGNEPLVLTHVTASCDCSTVDWTRTPILPGEKGMVTATFDASLLGHFEKSVAIYSNAEPHLAYLYFGGEVVSEITDYTRTHPYEIGRLRVNRTELDFPDIHKGDKPEILLEVVNQNERPYEPVLMHLPPYLKMEAKPNVILKGKKGVLKLTLDSDQLKDYGLTQASVYLARFAGDKIDVENEIPFSVVMLPSFAGLSKEDSLNAPVIALSEQEIDLSRKLQKRGKATHHILITNTGKRTLHIDKLQVFNTSLRVFLRKTSLEPGESTKLKVTVYKRNTGNKKHHMRILMITNDPNHPKVTVNVKR